MKNSKILITVVLVTFVVGAGGFFAGMQYQKSKRFSVGDFQNMRGQQGVGFRVQISGTPLQGQGRPVSGEIISKDEKSITVKLTDGSSRIVFVGETTEINKTTAGSKDDLTEGTQVLAIGTENSDGSITAASIQMIQLSD